jgi:hypothetical protein
VYYGQARNKADADAGKNEEDRIGNFYATCYFRERRYYG